MSEEAEYIDAYVPAYVAAVRSYLMPDGSVLEVPQMHRLGDPVAENERLLTDAEFEAWPNDLDIADTYEGSG